MAQRSPGWREQRGLSSFVLPAGATDGLSAATLVLPEGCAADFDWSGDGLVSVDFREISLDPTGALRGSFVEGLFEDAGDGEVCAEASVPTYGGFLALSLNEAGLARLQAGGERFDLGISQATHETSPCAFDCTWGADASLVLCRAEDEFDGDASPCGFDRCPDRPNPDQADADADGQGDACDPTPTHDLAVQRLVVERTVLSLAPGSAVVRLRYDVKNLRDAPERFNATATLEGLPANSGITTPATVVFGEIAARGKTAVAVEVGITCSLNAVRGLHAITGVSLLELDPRAGAESEYTTTSPVRTGRFD